MALGSILARVRFILYVVLILFSIVELGLSAHAASAIGGGSYAYAAFVGAFTFILITGWLVLNRMGTFAANRHIFVSIIVELGMLAFLWILWVAAAGSTTGLSNFAVCGDIGFYAGYGGYYYNSSLASSLKRACNEGRAQLAFAWLSWLIVFFQLASLLALSLMEAVGSKRNNQIWTSNSATHPWDAPAPVGGIQHQQAVGQPQMNEAKPQV